MEFGSALLKKLQRILKKKENKMTFNLSNQNLAYFRKKIMNTKIFILFFMLCLSNIYSQPGFVTEFIKVDQFGYLPQMQKIAVISNPIEGFNSDDSFVPSNSLQVRSSLNNELVFEGAIYEWNNGITHSQSGDQVWWFDFSNVQSSGKYYVFDPNNNVSSFVFNISDNVYNEVLKHSLRTFYYQRCGVSKNTPYANSFWTDKECHLGKIQDLDCQLISDMTQQTSLDLSGGWHDAGDYNKYVNYAYATLHDLLFAYEENPNIWSDNLEIPESGNGIPDILDEIKWELDWLLKMQIEDGSVLHKVSAINWNDAESPPSKEETVRCYAPATASATISSCGTFAHAAIVFKSINNSWLQNYSDTLETAAISAWEWIENNPDLIPSNYDNAGFQNASAELPEYSQKALITTDASYLFVLTEQSKYKEYFDSTYNNCNLFNWGAVHYIFEDPVILDGLLYYSKSPNATNEVVQEIFNEYANAMKSNYNDIAPIYDYENKKDAYLAYLDEYDWGSNQQKGTIGTLLSNMIKYEIEKANNAKYYNASSGFIHYLHGINPLSLVYLSNMNNYEAEKSVPEFYHLWFADGTEYDNVDENLYGPAPGFLVGGPNENYESPGNTIISPPENQPAQKSYKSWNTSAENSWEITENQITYQASFIRLLSKFAQSDNVTSIEEQSEHKPSNIDIKTFPNPFNNSVKVCIELPEDLQATITIFNSIGQKVKQLYSGQMKSGKHELNWNTNNLSSGVYLCNLKTATDNKISKLLLIK